MPGRGDFPDPFTFLQLFQTGNGQNSGDYSNPQYDALIDQASNIDDAAKRFQLFHQAEHILNEDAPTIPVLFLGERSPRQALREGLAIQRNGSHHVTLHVYPGTSGELNLIRYTISRLAGAIPTLLIIITLSFLLLHAAPGGPFDSQKQIPPAIKANIERMYHLDEPLYKQYARYLGSILRGDFGPSYQYRDTTVNEIIREGFPIDALIGGFALLGALLIGLPIGIIAALRRNTYWDYLPMGLSMIGISVPVFVVAPILILVFAVNLHWLPAGGWVGISPSHIILPALALAAPYVAYVARLMRGSMVEVLNSPYILMARAKGVPEPQVILRHALKPALMPLVSFLGPATAGIITGSIVIETIFGLPGIGRAFVDGALNRDYTLVLGVTILYGALIVLFNFLADISYSLLDPRVRYE